MDEIIKSLLASGSLTAVLFLILWYWFSERLKASIKTENKKELTEHKAKIDHEYSQKLASHTAQLSRDSELEITKFKHELEKSATDQHFRFSQIFDKTANTIAQTHTKLIELCDAINAYSLSVEGPEDERKAEVFTNLRAKCEVDPNLWTTKRRN